MAHGHGPDGPMAMHAGLVRPPTEPTRRCSRDFGVFCAVTVTLPSSTVPAGNFSFEQVSVSSAAHFTICVICTFFAVLLAG